MPDSTTPDSPVALITFAGDYVGPPLARLLARSGHRLVLHQPSSEFVDELRDGGAEVVALGTAGEAFMAGTGGPPPPATSNSFTRPCVLSGGSTRRAS